MVFAYIYVYIITMGNTVIGYLNYLCFEVEAKEYNIGYAQNVTFKGSGANMSHAPSKGNGIEWKEEEKVQAKSAFGRRSTLAPLKT